MFAGFLLLLLFVLGSFKRIIVLFPYTDIVFTQHCFNSVICTVMLSSSNWITGPKSIQKAYSYSIACIFLNFCDTPEKVTLSKSPDSLLVLPGMRKKKDPEITNGETNTDKIIIKLCFPREHTSINTVFNIVHNQRLLENAYALNKHNV